jgi:hypothetical protein
MNVSQLTVRVQLTAVIAETTSWEAYPEIWPRLLDEVWSAVRPRRREIVPGRNVMLYKDDVPNVEERRRGCGIVRVARTDHRLDLPAGRVAMATHHGSWDVGPANRAVIDECERLGLERAEPRWEIYGHSTSRAMKRSRSTTSCGKPWAQRRVDSLRGRRER